MNINLNTDAVDFDEQESVVIRFAGDSGDGMQLTGTQFTTSTALAGNDLSTFPDYPAEIRAPQGTTFGVSAFQINFGATSIFTAGDDPDVLVAMNPAALKVSLPSIPEGGMLVIDSGAFTKRNLQKAGYDENPLETSELAKYHVVELDISSYTLESVKEFGLGNKEAIRCKNMWTLGLMLWMFSRDRKPIVDWLNVKFAKKPDVAKSNVAALNAGHVFGETSEMSAGLKRYHIKPAKTEPGLYRTVTGAETLSWGVVAGGQLANLPIMLGSYPITPASPVLHTLSNMKEYGVITFQAEDEIAAICSAIGASFGGALGVTSSSGPGIALKGEAMGLAISTELPLLIINVQRGGPSTGLPTKTEQSDLYQAFYGRNGDAPIPILSTRSPSDCFETAIEAIRIATKYMTPVILLSDGYIANAAEPWSIPDFNSFEAFPAKFADAIETGEGEEKVAFNAYSRDDALTRPWAKPGTKGLEHRIGGLEKSFETGHISYDADNHQKMTDVRHERVAQIAQDIPLQEIECGDENDDLLVIGWGSTFGAIEQGVSRARAQGLKVAHVHLKYINPFSRNLGDIISKFDKILIPEMNTGQLMTVLRDKFLLKATPLNKVDGQPFKIREVLAAIRDELAKGDDK
jgi:2-oxoglutarate ferredoxin oxidoreductase subunit alpha